MITEIENTVNLEGRVVSQSGAVFLVETNEERLEAKKAFSCVYEPQIGDIVALYKIEVAFFIVHILHREQTRNREVQINGKLSLVCDELDIKSGKVNGFVDSIKTVFSSMTYEGKLFKLVSEIFKSSGNSKESTYIEDVTKSDRSYKYVNGHEEIQCKSSRHLSEESRVVRAENLVMTAKEQVKIDGENINLA